MAKLDPELRQRVITASLACELHERRAAETMEADADMMQFLALEDELIAACIEIARSLE